MRNFLRDKLPSIFWARHLIDAKKLQPRISNFNGTLMEDIKQSLETASRRKTLIENGKLATPHDCNRYFSMRLNTMHYGIDKNQTELMNAYGISENEQKALTAFAIADGTIFRYCISGTFGDISPQDLWRMRINTWVNDTNRKVDHPDDAKIGIKVDRTPTPYDSITYQLGLKFGDTFSYDWFMNRMVYKELKTKLNSLLHVSESMIYPADETSFHIHFTPKWKRNMTNRYAYIISKLNNNLEVKSYPNRTGNFGTVTVKFNDIKINEFIDLVDKAIENKRQKNTKYSLLLGLFGLSLTSAYVLNKANSQKNTETTRLHASF